MCRLFLPSLFCALLFVDTPQTLAGECFFQPAFLQTTAARRPAIPEAFDEGSSPVPICLGVPLYEKKQSTGKLHHQAMLTFSAQKAQIHLSSTWLKPVLSGVFLLTLPRPEGRGFFLHPACLRGAAVRRRVAAGCPEAFDETPSSVPVCPTVPCSALCKIFKAAL
ncbi:hypothetical protein EI42_02416 [Thermosporothrix hazakensis]|jgi:hypothetical protein|uniref:Secreted protein n=1 Tax=Thermosporothrix hazakensis TaxID=644383 RepID=A0A326U6L9_THEHA|nr:hypothetical protein EI42_02416 [Thermosporothrix hazakensis]